MNKFLFISAAIFLLSSCKKQHPTDLYNMEISGFVFDSTHQTGVSNVQVRAFWQGSGGPSAEIKTGTTDAQGKFRLKLFVDTSRLRQENIVVSIFAPENYISYGHPQVQEASSIKSYATEVQVQRFILFEKALVTISFRRMQNDAVEDFKSSYSFFEGDSHDLLQFTSATPMPIGISYIDLKTAAGAYTKVSWTKKLASGSVVTYKDSILCRPNTTNSIMVDF